MNDITYVAGLKNVQGACLPAISGTKTEINRELKTYYDAEALEIEVTNENDSPVGTKPFGRKTIVWSV